MCSDALRTRSRKTPTRRIACDLEHLLSQSAGKVCYLRRVLSQRCACSGACYLRAVLCQSCALSELCFLRRGLPQSWAFSAFRSPAPPGTACDSPARQCRDEADISAESRRDDTFYFHTGNSR